MVHATLGESEWPGALESARDRAAAIGAQFEVAQAEKICLAYTKHLAFVLYRRPNAARAAILDDLLALAENGQQEAVNTAITMLHDLFEQGHRSSYARKLQGLPIWELKSHARGGTKGGTRIYFYFRGDGDQVIVNAEIKAGVSPSAAVLREATAAAFADDQRS